MAYDLSILVEDTRSRIRDIYRRVARPAILLSGGKESSVLHWLTQDDDKPYVCLYDEVQPERLRFVEELFIKKPFRLLNFRPYARNVYSSLKGLDLYNLYDLGGRGFLQTVVAATPGDYCLFDWLDLPTRTCPDFAFDGLIAGGRKDDWHEVLGNYVQPEVPLRGISIFHPLYEWTEDAIWKAIHTYDILYDRQRYDQGDPVHLDNLSACTRCLSAEDTVPCPKLGVEVTPEIMRRKYLERREKENQQLP